MKKNKITLSLLTVLTLSSSLFANEANDIALLKQEIKDLKEITQSLIDETSDLKSGFTSASDSKSYSGLGQAASKIYNTDSKFSFGGYAKMDYTFASTEGADNSNSMDIYRFIPYIGYKFTDNIIMNAEIEFEHGGSDDGADKDGYVIVEFLYLDFLFNKNINLRVGNMLMPMGLINEKHEPTLFTTSQRPNTSKLLIPSTWHENGIMAHGQISDNFSYKVGAFAALQLERGSVPGTSTSDKWLRDSRVGSFRTTSDESAGLAGVARVDYTGINGLFVGASTYVDGNLVMADVHFDYNLDAFRTYGVYTQTNRFNTVVDEPEKAKGGFINIGYDILSFTQSNDKMPVFIQYESVSARDAITGANSVDSTDTMTVGINYFPHEQIVLKADYAKTKNNAETDSSKDEIDTFTLSMGFIF